MTLVWHIFVALAAIGSFAALFFAAMVSFLEWRSSIEARLYYSDKPRLPRRHR